MDYSGIISQILEDIDKNRFYIFLKVLEKLFNHGSFDKQHWSLKRADDDDQESTIIEGNLDMAIIIMDSLLKRANKSGRIEDWIEVFSNEFKEEIDNFIYTFDNEGDSDFGKRIISTFTLPNIISIMYDKLKEAILDNDSVWLEPIKKD